jgi:hypothetical protein
MQRLPPSATSFEHIGALIIITGDDCLLREVLLAQKNGSKWLVLIKKEMEKCQRMGLADLDITGATCWRLMIESLLLAEQLHTLGLRLSYPPQQLLQMEDNCNSNSISLLKVRGVNQP